MVLIWVAAYGAVFSAAQRLAPPGQPSGLTILALSLYWAALFFYVTSRGPLPGWCSLNAVHVRASLPLLLIPAVNLLWPIHPLSPGEAMVIVLCAWGEEVLFRGVLLLGLCRRWGRSRSLLISSLLFALLHLANIFSAPGQIFIQTVYAGALGFCFAVLTLRTRSIVPAFVIHSLINLTAAPGQGNAVLFCLSAACLLYGLWLYKNTRNSR